MSRAPSTYYGVEWPPGAERWRHDQRRAVRGFRTKRERDLWVWDNTALRDTAKKYQLRQDETVIR